MGDGSTARQTGTPVPRSTQSRRGLQGGRRDLRAGEPGYGPWRIDKLGRVVEQPSRKDRKPKKQFRAGQIGAMVADYMDHDVYMSNTEKTKAEYKIYLDIFVEKFGESYWRTLAPGVVREWLLERAASGGPAGAHALYRTARAFFGRVRLCYDTVDHPGFVPKHENPLLPTPSIGS